VPTPDRWHPLEQHLREAAKGLAGALLVIPNWSRQLCAARAYPTINGDDATDPKHRKQHDVDQHRYVRLMEIRELVHSPPLETPTGVVASR
jgi:hypothetical protein